MRICIHRHADIAMSKYLLYDLRMNTHAEQEGCCTVPKIMKPHRWKTSTLEEVLKHHMQLPLVEKSSKAVREDQIMLIHAVPTLIRVSSWRMRCCFSTSTTN